MFKSLFAGVLFFTVCNSFGNADASEHSRHARRFECRELRGLPHLSREYQDTLEACIWDYQHPYGGTVH